MVKIIFAGMATVAVSAVGATALVPTMQTVTVDVLQAAAIDESSSTIGFADSDLYGMTPAQIDQQLDQMQALGVNDVRIMIPWAGVEFYPNYYTWDTVDYMVNAADSRGMGILGVLNSTPYWATQPGQPALSGAPASPQAYGDFAGLVAQRYAGKVGAYEIWNEPNAYIFYSPQPDPAGYTALLKAAYPEIKAADPNATVIGGVLGSVITYGNLTMNPIDFVNGIYSAGGQPYFDALSFHPYQYTLPFSTGGWHPDSPINQLTAMRNVMVANGDADKLIWASEYGEPSSVAGEANQAAYLQDMLATWRTLDYAGPTFVWTLQDRNSSSTGPEDTFGVVRSDGTLKPAAYVIQQLASSSATTPAMARTALAMPEAVQAAPADLAALTQLAGPDSATVAPEPQTPMGAAMQVAAATLAAVNQLAAATLQQANAMVMSAVPQTAAVSPAVPGTSPTAVPTKQINQLRSSDLAAVPAAPPASGSASALSAETASAPKTPDQSSPAAASTSQDASTTASTAAPEQSADAPRQSSADAPKSAAESPKRSDGDRQKPRQDRNR